MKKCFNSNHVVLVLVVFGILVTSIPIFAHVALASTGITATTDKSSYIFGDRIVVYGTIKNVVQGSSLTIRILDPYSNLIQTGQGNIVQDGAYIGTIEIAGPHWKTSGVYTVQVQYGSATQAQTIFTYVATTAPTSNMFQVQVPGNNQIFDVPYVIFGGVATSISANPADYSLTVSIQPTNYGAITLSLPRALLDAKTSDGTDGLFTILIDGTRINPQKEQTTPTYRTLTIQFVQGDQDIQIIGTNLAYENSSAITTSNTNFTTTQQSSSQIANMSKQIPAVPEFPLVVPIFLIGFIALILFHKTR